MHNNETQTENLIINSIDNHHKKFIKNKKLFFNVHIITLKT